MIVCGKHHVCCLYDCVKTSLSDCSTLYWKQQNIYPWYSKIDNSAIRQYFQTKFCAYFTEYFRIKHTKFTQDAFRFHISVVHCVGFTFFPDTVYFRIKCTKFGQDALNCHISMVHCVGFTFSRHSVYEWIMYTFEIFHRFPITYGQT